MPSPRARAKHAGDVEPKLRPRVAAWLDPRQAGLVKSACAAAKVELMGAGSAARAQTATVSGELGCAALTDLRSALIEADADVVLIAAPAEFGGDANDVRALAAARSRGVKVATLEPLPASALELSSPAWSEAGHPAGIAEGVRIVPLPRFTRALREAAEALGQFGAPRCITVEAWSGAGEGSLGARLVGAIDLVLAHLGEPEGVDAAFVSELGGQGVHALPGETLADLHGDITMNLRFAGGRSAAIVASDRASRWNFGATFLSAHGRLRFYDDGFEWLDQHGNQVDQTRFRKAGRGMPANLPHSVAALGDALARMTDPHIPDTGPVDLESILSVAQAALLSARTGQSESPASIRRMATGRI